jgi:cytochrome bd-type quinol oxidase subunit 1
MWPPTSSEMPRRINDQSTKKSARKALRTGEERYAKAARFWVKIFGLNFAVGVVTGIPMEFQFGTNWAAFSKYSGEVIGQTLAIEGMFAFLLESAMVGALVAGLAASVLVAFPTGDAQAKMVAHYQEVSLAAMEGRFQSGPMAGIALIGQPNVRERRLDNPIELPGVLSLLAYGTFHSDVRGLIDPLS